MKKTIFITLFIISCITSFSQTKKDSTYRNKDTVDISSSKIFKIDGKLFSTAGIKNVKYFLTDADINVIMSELATYPYVNVSAAIEYLKKVFGLVPPQK